MGEKTSTVLVTAGVVVGGLAVLGLLVEWISAAQLGQSSSPVVRPTSPLPSNVASPPGLAAGVDEFVGP